MLLLRVFSVRESVLVQVFLSAFVRAALPVVLGCFVCVGSGSGLGRVGGDKGCTRVRWKVVEGGIMDLRE